MLEFTHEVPIEILYKTLTFLPINNINNICRSEKLLRDVCQNEDFWSYYIKTNYLSQEFGFNEWNKNIFNSPVLKELNIKSWKQLVNLINNGKAVKLQIWFDDTEPDPVIIYLNDTIKSISDRLRVYQSISFYSDQDRITLPSNTNINSLLSKIILDNGKTLFGSVELINIM